MDEKILKQRRMTRGLILLGSAVAVVATPIWMAAQQQVGNSTTTPAASTPPVTPPIGAAPVTPLAPPITSPVASPIIVATTLPTTTAANGKPPTTQISVRFKDASIDAVLEHLSKVAGYSVIKTVPVDGRVTVWSDQPISPEKAVELLNSLLKDRGYTAIVQGSVLKVGQISDLKKQNVPVHISANPDDVPVNDDLVTWVIPVRSVDAVKLKTDLQPLVSANADLSANGGSNSIIITDTNANVHRIVDIVANLDKHDATENEIIVQHLIYADATATAKLITDIFAPASQSQQQGNGQGQNNFARFFGGGGQGGGGQGGRGGGGGGFGGGGFGGGPGGGGPGGGQAAAQGSEEGKTGTVTASADTRTNTVVVTGPKDTLAVVKEKILAVIDKDPVVDQVIYTYRVKNGQAVDMAATLNTLFGASGSTGSQSRGSTYSSSTGNRTSTGFGSSGGSGSSLGGGSSNSFGGTSLGSSSNRNSTGSGSSGSGSSSQSRTGTGGTAGGISSSGTSGTGSTSDLVGQVEVVPDSDTNSLMVVTATRFRPDVDKIIAELDRPIRQVLIKVLIAEVTHDRSDDLGVDFSSLNLSKGLTYGLNEGNVAAAQALVANGGGSGLSVNLVESQITSTFHALATAGKLDVLSRPYILTSENQEATILVGQEVPFVTNTRVDTLGGTTSSIQYQDIGIILDVTPHVNEDGLVVMDVSPQISSQAAESLQLQAGVTSPIFNQRSASSHVGVRDGDTIVIGGLMQDQKTMTITKIPLLGDIPYLGLLFQRDQVSKTKTELLIFLTPHVAQVPDHLVPMSEAEIKRLKLTPGAVQPGTFEDHIKGMQAGGSATQPSLVIPKAVPDRDAWEPEPKMP